MSSQELWILFTKSKSLNGCTINFDGCEFYFVEAFVHSNSIKDAISQAKQILLQSRFSLSDISKCIRYQENEWSSDTQMNIELKKAATFAMETNQPKIGVFRSQEIEDDCVYTFRVDELDSRK